MRRRDFIWLLGGSAVTCMIGCEDSVEQLPTADAAPGVDEPHPTDARGIDACMQQVIKMHDTNAQALYLDGSYGPLTGIVTVASVIASSAITMDFWHGHGGIQHRFTLEPMHFDALKRGERVTVGTTTVEGHAHTLFVDPRDETYRVQGAPDVEVPLGC